MKRVVRIALRATGLLLLVAVLAAGGWIYAHRAELGAFLPQPAGAHAKLLCSGLFVEGRSLEDARAWAAVPVPVSDERVDLRARTVTVTVLFHTRTARFVDERRGCILD